MEFKDLSIKSEPALEKAKILQSAQTVDLQPVKDVIATYGVNALGCGGEGYYSYPGFIIKNKKLYVRYLIKGMTLPNATHTFKLTLPTRVVDIDLNGKIKSDLEVKPIIDMTINEHVFKPYDYYTDRTNKYFEALSMMIAYYNLTKGDVSGPTLILPDIYLPKAVELLKIIKELTEEHPECKSAMLQVFKKYYPDMINFLMKCAKAEKMSKNPNVMM